jgi:phage gp29-like protein
MSPLRAIYLAVKDALGQPVAERTLRERQSDTPRLERLHGRLADHPVRGLTPQRMASMLDAADEGDVAQQSALFHDMRDRDPHLDAEMGKRERAILTVPWSIEPPRGASREEVARTEQLAELVAAIPDVEDVLLGMMDAAGHGFSCQEVTWSEPSAGERLPVRIEHRPQTWFRLDRETRTEIRLIDDTGQGEPLWPMGWMVHRHAARAGYIYRGGIYRVLAWPWAFRQFSLRDMGEWLEIYGLPMRIGKYPSGAQPDDKRVLARAVQDIGRHASGIMPADMEIELKEAAKGQSDPFLAMVEYADRCISRAILGGTLSSTAESTGMGSGTADLQGEVRRDLLVSDCRQTASTLTRDLLWPIAVLNGLFDDPRRCPVWTYDTREPEDLTAFSQSLERLVNAGAGGHIPVSWVREKAGIPEPVGDEPTLARPVADVQPPTGRQMAASLAAEPDAGKPLSPGQQRADALVDAAAAEAERTGGPIPAADILAAVRAARSPEDLEARLLSLLDGGWDESAYRTLLDRAIFTADVSGYVAAHEEAR